MKKKNYNFSVGSIIKQVFQKKTIPIAICFALIFPTCLYANPEGGEVVAGAATIVQESVTKLGVNQHTDKAIINWKSFDIDTKEHTQFYQPAVSSVALNRITGSSDPSQILGQLTANGRIYLVNPNGVVFGRNAKVDVAALVASTHDIRNDDFMAGRFNFTIPGNPKASIINQGNITVADKGLVAFVAPGVQNSGVITARLGKVQLASANGFTLDFYGDELIQFMVDEKVTSYALDAEGNPMDALVDNTGKISTDGGYVLLTADAARDIVNKAVNSSGVIEAQSVAQQNGEIVLHGGDYGIVSVDGTLDATGRREGEKGGRIQITGEKIGLFAGAILDVSGDVGGGTALVGGDYLGGTADAETVTELGVRMEDKIIPTAQFTYMDSNAVIRADALTKGDGGKIVVWADHTTRAYGSISTSGGLTSGDGGFVEVSGKQYLDIDGIDVSASASAGKAGTVLFDPGNVVIGTPAQAIATYDVTNFVSTTAPGTTTYISSSNIESVLNKGTNVVIKSTLEGPNGVDSTGDITVADDIYKTRGRDAQLSLFAADIVTFNSGVVIQSTYNKLNIYVDADYDRHSIGLVDLKTGSVIKTNGGWLNLNGSEFLRNGLIDTSTTSGTAGAVREAHDYFEHTNFSDILTPAQVYTTSSDPIIYAKNEKEREIFQLAEKYRPDILEIKDDFDAITALEAGLLAAVAYKETNQVKQWLSDRGYELMGTPLDDDGNQAYLARKTIDGKTSFVITIRGTEFFKDGDVKTDVDVKSRISGYLSPDVEAHEGFVQLAEAVYEMLSTSTDFSDEFLNGDATLTISGHSLGGAAAILLTAMLQEKNSHFDIKDRMQTYTFGAPNPLDAPKVNPYEDLNVHRVEAQWDPVPDSQYKRETIGDEITLDNFIPLEDGTIVEVVSDPIGHLGHSMVLTYLHRLIDQEIVEKGFWYSLWDSF